MRLTNLTACLAVSFLALHGAGCADRAEYLADGTVVRDSAGITIVRNPDAGTATFWRLSEEPILEIGGTPDGPDGSPHRFIDAVRLADGRIAAAATGVAEIMLFDPEGRRLGSLGRYGLQWGQFQQIANLFALADGSVAGFDTRSLRFEVFDSAGHLIRSNELDIPYDLVPLRLRPLADGDLLLVTERAGREPGPGGILRAQMPYLLLNPRGVLQDTIATFPGEAWVRDGGTFAQLPFGPSTEVAIHGSEFFVSRGEHYQFEVYDKTGQLQRLIGVARAPRPVTRQDRDAYRDEILSGFAEPELPTEALAPDILAVLGEAEVRALLEEFRTQQAATRMALEESLARTVFPERLPAFAALLADPAGNIWAERFRTASALASDWDIFDARGFLVATAQLPAPFRPFQIGQDFVLGRWRDTSDRDRLRMYRLQR